MARAETPQHALELLRGVAVALGQDVDVDFLLAELASGVRQTLDADRVSVLLLDDAERLAPAVSVARQHDDDLWQRFRRMPPIALQDLPGARHMLSQGAVVVIDDASASPLVPVAWQRTFQLNSLAIAPLQIGEQPAGLVAVEYAEVAAPLSATELALLEGMAALASVALRNGRQRTQAQRVVSLSSLVRTMAAAHTTRAIAEQSLPALLETARVTHGLFATVSDDTVEVVAVRGTQLPEPGRYSIADLPAGVALSCHAAWAVDPRAVVGIELDGNAFTVLPIAGPKVPLALVLLPVAVPSLPDEMTADLRLMADVTATALGAVRLAHDRDWHRRALATMTSQVTAAPASAVTEVDAVVGLLADLGVAPARVVVDRTLARATGLPAAPAEVARQLTRWRRSSDARPVVIGAETALPLRCDGQLVGALLCQGTDGVVASRRVQYAANLVASLVGRAASQHRVEELALATTDAAAHRAVAARAYREAGQVLTTLAQHLPAGRGDARAATGRLLIDQARRLLRDAAEALGSTSTRQATLRTALTASATQLYAHGGPQTVVRQSGRLPAMDPAVQVALVRATNRVLSLLRDSRAAAVAVQLEADSADVAVTVRADHVLGSPLDADGPDLMATLRDARAWLTPVGGVIELAHHERPHRFVVRAPAGLRRPERPSPAHRQESREVVVPLGSHRSVSPQA